MVGLDLNLCLPNSKGLALFTPEISLAAQGWFSDSQEQGCCSPVAGT